MARPLRLDFPGARHHVMNRGARRAPIFADDASCALFLAALADLPVRFDVRVHAYALMPNHFHLLLETPRGNLSRAMQYLTGEHVRLLNEHQGWDGPVFKGRFRNRLVETDAYWHHLLLYLHLNPVRAHLVADIDDSYWTSHAAYVGSERRPDWLTTSDLLAAHGGVPGYREALYDLHTGRVQRPDEFDPDALWRPATSEPRPAPAAALPAVSPEAALERIGQVCGVDVGALRTARRGRGDNRARWLAAWWLTAEVGLTQRVVAGALGATEQQVSLWIGRFLTVAADDAEVAGWLEALRAAPGEPLGVGGKS
ncbi:MAG: transposase [Pseudomonadota bacterium]|nr:transposase [Pseudomonadota bacterium]